MIHSGLEALQGHRQSTAAGCPLPAGKPCWPLSPFLERTGQLHTTQRSHRLPISECLVIQRGDSLSAADPALSPELWW